MVPVVDSIADSAICFVSNATQVHQSEIFFSQKKVQYPTPP